MLQPLWLASGRCLITHRAPGSTQVWLQLRDFQLARLSSLATSPRPRAPHACAMPRHAGPPGDCSSQQEAEYPHFYAWLQRQHHAKAAGSRGRSAAAQPETTQPEQQLLLRRAAPPPALQRVTQARPASAPPAAAALLIRPCSAAVTSSTGARHLDKRTIVQPQQQQARCGANRTAAGCQRLSSAAQPPAATHAAGVVPRWLAGWGVGEASCVASWGGGGSSRQQAPGSPVRPMSSPLGRPMSAATASTRAARPARPRSPWAALGTDAPLRWQQLSTHDDGSQQQSAEQQQPQQRCQHHAAEQLFKRLPLSGHTCMTRADLQLLAVGLQQELLRVGAPLELPETLPPTTHPPSVELLPELEVWSKLTAEVCRQVELECTQRGELLRLAVGRQQEMLQQALCRCDALQHQLSATTGSQQQHQQALLQAQAVAQELQQDVARLRAAGEAKQAKFVSAMRELEHLQERMRRGRFDLIQQQVQEARVELERRMLRDGEHRLNQAQAAAAEAAAERERALLQAVTVAAGHEVAAAVRQQLEAFT